MRIQGALSVFQEAARYLSLRPGWLHLTVSPAILFRLFRSVLFVCVSARALILFLGGVLVLSPTAFLLFVAGAVWLCRLDIRVSSERLLYANLGVSPLHVLGSVLAAVALIEGVLRVAVFGLLPVITGIPTP